MVIKEIANQNCRYLIQTPPGCDIPSAYVSCDNFVAANGMRILANYREIIWHGKYPSVE